jgi:hypothetical protein
MLWDVSTRERGLLCSLDLLPALLVAAQKVDVTGKASALTHVGDTGTCLERVLPLTRLDLTGVGIAETIKGIQDAGVIACAKHYIGNEQVC